MGSCTARKQEGPQYAVGSVPPVMTYPRQTVDESYNLGGGDSLTRAKVTAAPGGNDNIYFRCVLLYEPDLYVPLLIKELIDFPT
jgi:hypothetical protein